MEKPFKIILITILALLTIQFIVSTFFVSPGLKASIKKLEESQQQLDNALQEVKLSRARIDSIQSNVMKFSNYLITIQGQTEVLYKDRELKDARFKAQRDTIISEMAKLRIKMDSIPLPELTVYDFRQRNP